MTILISSHILSELEMVVDRYIIMHKGLIVKEFSKQELEQTLEEQLYLQTNNHPKTLTTLEDHGIAYKIDKDYISLSSDTNVMNLIHLLINHEIEVKEILNNKCHLKIITWHWFKKEKSMIHYFKADLFKIQKNRD